MKNSLQKVSVHSAHLIVKELTPAGSIVMHEEAEQWMRWMPP